MSKPVCLTALAAILALPSVAQAGQFLGLQSILSGRGYYGKSIKSVDKVQANSRGGEVKCTIKHPNTGITEQVRAIWSFDRDVSTLTPGMTVRADIRIAITKASRKQHPSRPTNWSACSSGLPADGKIIKRTYPDASKMWSSSLINPVRGGFQRLLARKTKQTPKENPQTGVYFYRRVVELKVFGRLPDKRGNYTTMMPFGLMSFYQVVYIYRTNTAGRKATLGRTSSTGTRRTGTTANGRFVTVAEHEARSFNMRYVSVHNRTNQNITFYFRYRTNQSGGWTWAPGGSSWVKTTLRAGERRRLRHNGRWVTASRLRFVATGSRGSRWTSYRNTDYWVARTRYRSVRRTSRTIELTSRQ